MVSGCLRLILSIEIMIIGPIFITPKIVFLETLNQPSFKFRESSASKLFGHLRIGESTTFRWKDSLFFFFFFFHLTFSRWTSSLPSCLWSQRIFPFLPGSRLTFFNRDASSALLQLVNQWLNLARTNSF